MVQVDAEVFPTLLPATAEHETPKERDGPVETDVPSVEDHEVKYPFNKTFKFSSGHILEFNNTPGNEFVRLAHGPMQTEVIMDKDGGIRILQDGNRYEKVGGNTLVEHTGSYVFKCDSDYTLDIKGDLKFRVGGVLKYETSDEVLMDTFESLPAEAVQNNKELNTTASSGVGGGGSSPYSESFTSSKSEPSDSGYRASEQLDNLSTETLQAGFYATDLVAYEDNFESVNIRNKPVQRELVNIMDYATQRTAGVTEVIITSGGQPPTGPDRTGSHRHDYGYAADIQLIGTDGRALSFASNSKDIPTVQTWLTHAISAGLISAGAGNGYMGDDTMHVDIAPGNTVAAGSARSWSKKGVGAPSWLKAVMG